MCNIQTFKLTYCLAGLVALLLFSCSDADNPVDPVEPVVIVNPETKVLSAGAMQSVTQLTENEIIFKSPSPELTALKAGNILVSGEGHGLLRKIKALEITATEVKIQTDSAGLTDIFQQAAINLTQSLTADDFTQVTPLAKGVELITASAGLFNFEIKNLVLYDADGNHTTTQDQIRVNGGITLSNPKFQIEIDISSFAVKYLLFTGTMEQSSDLKIDSDLQLIHYKKEFQIMRLEGKPIVFLVGGVPVVLTPVFSVAVGINLDAGVSIQTSIIAASQQATYTAGIVYKKGNVTRVSDFSNQFQFQPPTVSVNCNLRGYACPKLEIRLYNVVSLYVKPLEYLEINAQIYNIPWWGLYAGLEVCIGIAVDVFHLFDVQYEYQVAEVRRLLADAGGAFNFPAHGLMADYPFNGNANDETENKNHGAINGAVLVNDRFDYPNKAFRFDGVNDYIEIPYSPANHPVHEISVVSWFKIDSLRGHQDLVSTNQFGGYALEFHADNQLYWELNIGGHYSNVHVRAAEVTRHQWHCVVGMYDGQSLKIYLDGILKEERAQPGTIHYAYQNSVLIGADAYEKKGPDPGFGYFQGDLDDIRIYNRVLSESEIQTLAIGH